MVAVDILDLCYWTRWYFCSLQFRHPGTTTQDETRNYNLRLDPAARSPRRLGRRHGTRAFQLRVESGWSRRLGQGVCHRYSNPRYPARASVLLHRDESRQIATDTLSSIQHGCQLRLRSDSV